MLDLVARDAESMRQQLGPADRAVLSDYLDSVREVERRVQKMEAQDLSHLKLPAVPLGIPEQFPEQQALMFDMIALAFQANLTHIATMTMAHEVSSMTYPLHRCARLVPSDLPSPGRPDEDREADQDSDLPLDEVGRVPEASRGTRPTAMGRFTITP